MTFIACRGAEHSIKRPVSWMTCSCECLIPSCSRRAASFGMNVSSLPEVVGDAALLIDPLDSGAIAQAIRRVLLDSDLREDLRQRGLRRVKEFSWERSVRRVREIYDEVLAE